MTNRCTICLGANAPHSEATLAEAFARIAACGTIMAATPLYPTDPEYAGDKAPYINRVLVLHTSRTLQQLHGELKEYETAVRKLACTTPLVALDIDIVLWNDRVLRPADAAACYFTKGLAMLRDS